MKHILVLGAGFVAAPLVDYLLATKRYQVTVTGLTEAEAERITRKRARSSAVALSITDEAKLYKLVAGADLVVSLLPYNFHVLAARACLRHDKSLITTSYAKDDIYQLDGEARRRGVLILKEMGLDPGIDHMSAMQFIDGVSKRGGTVVSFQSFCGGIPSPDADNNPWHYKFSWSPIGVLIAGKSDVRYRKDGRIEQIAGQHLPECTWPIRFDQFQFEGYPNRDSVPYVTAYRIPEAHTVIRGTLRYPGWTEMMAACNRLGLLDEREISGVAGLSHNAYLRRIFNLSERTEPKQYIADSLRLDAGSMVLARLAWLELFSDVHRIEQGAPLAPIDFMAQRMLAKMQYQPGERDMVVLYHEIEVKWPDRIERTRIKLVEYGEPDGHFAMSKTVALTAAVAADLVAQGKIELTGVQIPVLAEIYEPVLAGLAELGIRVEAQTRVLGGDEKN